MLVTLIRTPIIQPVHHITSNRPIPDIGLAYIHSSIHNAGYNTFVIDAAGEGIDHFAKIKNSKLAINGLTAKKIINRIPKETDIICLSSMHTNRWIYDSYIIRLIKQQFPQLPIIIGGEHVTGSYQQILETTPEVDICVLGEGDRIIVELLQRISGNSSYENVDGIAFINDKGEYQVNKRSERISDLDNLPFPRWEGFPIKKYFAAKSGIASFSKKSLPVVATRGCPHCCTFCTCSNMWESKWRARTPKNVVKEIEYLINKYQVEHIDFLDLTFTQNTQWTIEFCKLMIEKDFNISWALPIGTRTENLSDEVLTYLSSAGLKRILYSPESGSIQTLKRIKKKLNLAKFRTTVKTSVRLNMIVKFAIIFGFPGQTLREVFSTILFLIKAAGWGVHDVVCLAFVPYPGSVLHQQLVNDNKLDAANCNISLNNDIKNMNSWSSHIPSKVMPLISLGTMAIFYTLQYTLRPHRLLKSIYRLVIKRQPLTTIETILFYFFYRLNIKWSTEEDLSLSVHTVPKNTIF